MWWSACVCVCICVHAYVCMHVWERENLCWGEWDGQGILSLLCIQVFIVQLFFFLITEKKVKKGSFDTYFKNQKQEKNSHVDAQGPRITPRPTRYFTLKSFSNQVFLERYTIVTLKHCL